MSIIDADLLMKAMNFYQGLGYKPIPAPMLVDKDVVELTLPKGNKAKEHLGKYYVGSAEQSFYQLIKDGMKPDGSYMMITPCERDEVEDELHLGIFVKVELVSTVKTKYEILKDVSDFLYKSYIGHKWVETEGGGFDLEVNGIEVGSYGANKYLEYNINYGTGIAFPRLTQATGYTYNIKG